MNLRRIVVLLLILAVVALLRPKRTMAGAREAWARRERLLRVLVVTIAIYFLYGVWQLYEQGWFR